MRPRRATRAHASSVSGTPNFSRRLIAAIRTALTDPALTRSVGEFLTLEVIGHVLRRDDLPPEEANRRAGLVGVTSSRAW